MTDLQSALESVVLSVWQCTLGVAPAPRRPATSAPGEASRIIASVKLEGAWTGTLRLSCTPASARRAAGVMLGRAPGSVSADDALDAARELAHVVGGNLTPLLPQPLSLSMPTAVETSSAPPELGEEIARFEFEIEDQPLLIQLLAGAREGGAR